MINGTNKYNNPKNKIKKSTNVAITASMFENFSLFLKNSTIGLAINAKIIEIKRYTSTV
jgi:hypothetical protein